MSPIATRAVCFPRTHMLTAVKRNPWATSSSAIPSWR